MRQLTKSQDRKLFGVAGGMAEYFDVDKTVMRAICLIGCIFMPPLVLAYLVLGMLIPDPGAPPRSQPWSQPDPQPGPQPGPQPDPQAGPQPGPQPGWGPAPRRLTKSYDRWLSGVAGGIAQYFDTDPLLIRALFLVALFGFGTGLLAYIVLAIVMPRPDAA